MSRPTLLIVDDEPDIRLLSRALLSDRYEVVEAGGGREALEILRGRPDVQILLLDLRMPDVDGFEVLTRLSELELLDRLWVVVFSAYSEPELLSQVVDMGARAVLPKPFTNEELARTLPTTDAGGS